MCGQKISKFSFFLAEEMGGPDQLANFPKM